MLFMVNISYFFGGKYNSSKQIKLCKFKNDSMIVLFLMNATVLENMKSVLLWSH